MASVNFIDASGINPLITWPVAQLNFNQVNGISYPNGGSYWLQGSGFSWGDPVWTIGRMFNEYLVNSYCLEFVPRSTTITPLALSMAFVEDPAWVKTHTLQSYGTGSLLKYAPTEAAIQQVNGALQYPVWAQSACLDCTSYLPKQWRYVLGSDNFTSQTSDSLEEWNSRRQYASGVIMISGSENSMSAALAAGTVGDLFVRYSLTYHDIGPTLLTDLTGATAAPLEPTEFKLRPSSQGSFFPKTFK